MKLDRNTNRGGRGKYALVNMRKLIPILDGAFDQDGVSKEHVDIYNAFHLLLKEGIISLGNETPGDQFFVMKHKDKFTARGLAAYAEAVWDEYRALMHDSKMLERMEKQLRGEQLSEVEKAEGIAHHAALKSIREYHEQMRDEWRAAEQLGNRIPD